MPKLTSSTEWYKLARAQAALESMGMAVNARELARHVPYTERDITSTLEDATYQEFAEQFKRRRFGLWADSLGRDNVDIQRLLKPIGIKAVLAVEDLLDSEDDKVRVAAARLIFDFNPDMERPVVRHEITNRFSADEIEQARNIVRKLKEPSVRLPSIPDGEPVVN